MKEEPVNWKGERQDQSGAPTNDRQASLGQQIRKQREERGWSRRELAERARLNADTVKQIENGFGRPLAATRDKLENALEKRRLESWVTTQQGYRRSTKNAALGV